jgi:hypothetical protein
MADARIAAEVALYDIAAHAQHEKAKREAAEKEQPHSHIYWQWNNEFTGWQMTGHDLCEYFGSAWFDTLHRAEYPRIPAQF